MRIYCILSRAEQSRAEQNRTEQNRTEQNRTEQNRTDKSVLFGVCQRDNYRLTARTMHAAIQLRASCVFSRPRACGARR